MSYGIVRAWQSASELEQLQDFVIAVLSASKKELEDTCAADVEFIDITNNVRFQNLNDVINHLDQQWNLTVAHNQLEIQRVYETDNGYVASFTASLDGQTYSGIIMFELKNSMVNRCEIALGHM